MKKKEEREETKQNREQERIKGSGVKKQSEKTILLSIFKM